MQSAMPSQRSATIVYAMDVSPLLTHCKAIYTKSRVCLAVEAYRLFLNTFNFVIKQLFEPIIEINYQQQIEINLPFFGERTAEYE